MFLPFRKCKLIFQFEYLSKYSHYKADKSFLPSADNVWYTAKSHEAPQELLDQFTPNQCGGSSLLENLATVWVRSAFLPLAPPKVLCEYITSKGD